MLKGKGSTLPVWWGRKWDLSKAATTTITTGREKGKEGGFHSITERLGRKGGGLSSTSRQGERDHYLKGGGGRFISGKRD